MNIESLSMSFGTQTIFDNVSFIINNYDKIGIIGDNGAGKSTLLKILNKEITPDTGKIKINNNQTIGYLPQVITDEIEDKEIKVIDYLLEARPIKKLNNKLIELYNKISTIKDEQELKPYLKEIDKINNKLNYYDQYEAESILLKLISGMNIKEELLDLDIRSLSGGQKSKIAFTRLLYSKPDIILLDEPTNHLDKNCKDFIINYIKNYSGIALIVSHDIDFLNQVSNKIMYVDSVKHTINIYPGNYDKYLKIKENKQIALERLHEKQQKEEEKLKGIIAKYIRGNEKKANIAKDRIKKLEKLEKEKVVLDKAHKYTKFNMHIEYPSYQIPLSVNHLTFGYSLDNYLYENLTFDLNRGERFLVIGENGIGKTTLLKLIMSILEPLEGNINISPKTTIGYYAQEHEILNQEKTILENFKDCNMTEYEIKSFLGNFLFTGDDLNKKIKVLSPGERSRVSLAKIAKSNANTLLLDEPTNHLDPKTTEIITNTFKNYEGTILLVSHNLNFVEELGINRILLLPSGKIIYYNYDIVKYYESINNKE